MISLSLSQAEQYHDIQAGHILLLDNNTIHSIEDSIVVTATIWTTIEVMVIVFSRVFYT